jgi:predicted aminopeptidase
MTTLNVDLKRVKQVKELNLFAPPKFVLTLEKWGYGLTMFGFIGYLGFFKLFLWLDNKG